LKLLAGSTCMLYSSRCSSRQQPVKVAARAAGHGFAAAAGSRQEEAGAAPGSHVAEACFACVMSSLE
jgi:hypothetical protein